MHTTGQGMEVRKVPERSGRLSTMLWLRAIVFSALVPGIVAVWAPQRICAARPLQPAFWRAGWLLVAIGAVMYASCLRSFVKARGTPAIFFSRPLRGLVGQEPQVLVRGGLYRHSRNPMYVAVLAVVFGQALLYASWPVAVYGAALFAFFCGVVTLVEEPHLRLRDAESFESYRREVPRWIGFASPRRTDNETRR